MPPKEPISVSTEALKVALASALDAGLGRVRRGDVDAGLAVVHGNSEFIAKPRDGGSRSGRRGTGGKMRGPSHGRADARVRRPRADARGPPPAGGGGAAPAGRAGARAGGRGRGRDEPVRPRQAAAADPVAAGRRGAEGRPRGGAARRLRDRDGPHREPDPRRPALDGRRQDAARPADLPRGPRRGDRDPRRLRAHEPRLRDPRRGLGGRAGRRRARRDRARARRARSGRTA